MMKVSFMLLLHETKHAERDEYEHYKLPLRLLLPCPGAATKQLIHQKRHYSHYGQNDKEVLSQ